MTRDEADRAFRAYLSHRRPEDLARVFNEVAPRLLLLANHVVGEPGEAEDVVQATFLRAIEVADRFERGRPVTPWLIGILVLEAKKMRRRASRAPDPRRLSQYEEATPAEIAELEEFRHALIAALNKLPDSYTDVMTLRLVHGLTATEIAHALKLPPQTVKTRIRRGTDRLRNLVPAAFAPALAVVAFSGRSLAMVREAVLSAAAAQSAAGAAVSGAGTAGASSALRSWVLAGGLATVATVGAFIVFEGRGAAPEPETWRDDVPLAQDRDEPDLRTVVASVGPEEEAPGPPPRDRDLVSFEGRLRNERSWPIAGVEVQLLRLHPDTLLTPFEPLPAVLDQPPIVAGETTSDADGAFLIEDVSPWGVFVLRMTAPGAPPYVELLAVRPEPAQRVDLGNLRLAAPIQTRGKIVDPSGWPIPGARLRRLATPWTAPGHLGLPGVLLERCCDPRLEADGALALRGPRGWVLFEQPAWLVDVLDLLSAPPTFTGDDGRFVWTSAREGTVRLAVDAPGYALREVRIVPGHAAGPIVLEPLREIDLVITDVAGTFVPNAEVLLGTTDSSSSVIMQRVGTTDVARRDPPESVDAYAQIAGALRRDTEFHRWERRTNRGRTRPSRAGRTVHR